LLALHRACCRGPSIAAQRRLGLPGSLLLPSAQHDFPVVSCATWTGKGTMHKPIKYVEKGLTYAAKAAWVVYDFANRFQQNPTFTPTKWSDKPLLKSHQRTKPPLGWPRTTDSLCPRCVPEIRQQILDGKLPHEILLNERVGEIKAQIIERDGKILMVKDCPRHGHFEDVMSIDVDFYRHLEETFPGRDIRSHNDEHLHHHGTSTV